MRMKKYHQRTIDRIHILVRLRLGNPLLSDVEVAALVGLSLNRYSIIKATPVYSQIKNSYMTGLLTSLDHKVNTSLNLTQETINIAVPVAMQKLLSQIIQDKDLRVQNKACNDILDRHGRFAKVTRIGTATPEQNGVADEKDNKAVDEFVKALSKVPTITSPETPNINSPSPSERTQ